MATNGELAKAFIQIVPSAQGIKGSIENVLSAESVSAGKMAGTSIVSSLKKVIVGAGLSTVLSNSLMEGAKLQQSIGGIETLFKDSADMVKKYAQEAYRTAGISANSYMEQATSFSASLLQSLGGDTKKAAKLANQAIIDMADNSNKMGTSLEMIQNAYQGFAKQNYTMLDNLKLGYGGTKTEMERLLADAQKLSGVRYDISNLNDVYSAIHVVQEELGITGTTAKESASTFSGSMASMQSAAKNFLGNLALGENVAPSLQGLVETTVTFLIDNLLPMVGNVVMSIPTVIASGIPLIMEKGKELILKLTSAIQNEFPKMIETGTNSLISFVNGIMNKLPSILNTGGNLIINLVNAIIQRLPQIMDSAAKIVTSLVNGIINNLPKILEVGITLIGKLASGIVKAIPNVVGKAVDIYSQIKTKFKNLDWVQIGKDIINGIKNGIGKAVGSLVSAAKEAANKALKGIKNLLGIHSPSRVFETEVGKMISLGLAQGIENNLKPVTTAMNTLNDATMSAINTDVSASKTLTMNYENSTNEAFAQILDILNSINLKTEKEYSFSINGRQLAYALGGDMNIVLNKLNQNESRGR